MIANRDIGLNLVLYHQLGMGSEVIYGGGTKNGLPWR